MWWMPSITRVLTSSLLVAATLSACGSDEAAGLSLLSGQVAGEYKGMTADLTFGLAATGSAQSLIGFSSKTINCGSLESDSPPRGTFGIAYLPSLDAGTYGSVLVQMAYNEGSYAAEGTNSGTVTITASSETSIAGTVAYTNTNSDGETFALAGTFEVERCP